jgi:hypothetical protein|tara:strand:- start:6065 stop:6547 length:483 start_codon:yes stop_codon:yes gene_type:complete
MILDERTEFADNVSVAASAGTAQIGDVIDMEVVRNIGGGQPVYLVIRTGGTEIITGGSAGTLTFQVASNSAALAADGTDTVHAQTDALVTDGTDANAAELKVGAQILSIALPGQGVPYERYLGILAVTATTTTTAGTINAFLTLDPSNSSTNKAFVDATN